MIDILIVHSGPLAISETFIRAHFDHLPARSGMVTGWWPKDEDGYEYRLSITSRIKTRLLSRSSYAKSRISQDITAVYRKVLRHKRPDIVLAEYGPTGERIIDACRQENIPVVVHFHGYDASVRDVIADNQRYERIFRYAAGLIAVSREMECRLLELGAPRTKLFYNSYGVDLTRFVMSNPGQNPPTFLAVGRFVEKKSPHLTILAFQHVLAQFPEARLRIIGAGPLFPICQDLIRELNLVHAVSLLGVQSHEAVKSEMQRARAFVQHSVEASDGDCEGTPVAILEAGASGLPVIATRHAGIIDVVREGVTGYLVGERDSKAMSECMIKLAMDPELASSIGQAAASHVRENYSMTRSINNLRHLLLECAKVGVL